MAIGIGMRGWDDDPYDDDGSMFGPRQGTWWVISKIDPRWNASGRGYGLVCAGGPGETNDHLEYCRKRYGQEPDDLEVGFMKD